MVIVGRVKVPINDLFLLTKREIEALIRGHESDKKDDWERSRMNAYIVASPYMKSGVTPSQLWPLPWEGEHTESMETDIDQLKKDTAKAMDVFEKIKKLKENG